MNSFPELIDDLDFHVVSVTLHLKLAFISIISNLFCQIQVDDVTGATLDVFLRVDKAVDDVLVCTKSRFQRTG